MNVEAIDQRRFGGARVCLHLPPGEESAASSGLLDQLQHRVVTVRFVLFLKVEPGIQAKVDAARHNPEVDMGRHHPTVAPANRTGFHGFKLPVAGVKIRNHTSPAPETSFDLLWLPFRLGRLPIAYRFDIVLRGRRSTMFENRMEGN